VTYAGVGPFNSCAGGRQYAGSDITDFSGDALGDWARVRQKNAHDNEVTKATLENGLRVVIVRDPFAPVVTVQQNYLVGGDDTPNGFPGMAHAQEHMAFRGAPE